jgi:hypothetical protein
MTTAGQNDQITQKRFSRRETVAVHRSDPYRSALQLTANIFDKYFRLENQPSKPTPEVRILAGRNRDQGLSTRQRRATNSSHSKDPVHIPSRQQLDQHPNERNYVTFSL